ncbi:MAG: RNA polymerase sigma factor, partial [Gemmatimonadetes bacterium]|nr:RNA polymerase sigma factor [Gemmatimonadota bacterium]
MTLSLDGAFPKNMPRSPQPDDASLLAVAATPEPDDGAVVARVLEGDPEAYGILVRRYQAHCTRYATRILGSRHDAEDAVQTAFLRSYDALGRYHHRDRFRSWLFAILANECRAHLAARARRERRLVSDERELFNAPAPEGEVGQDAADRIGAALARLDPPLREAFLLHHVEELGYAEMVPITGAGVSALKMRVKRACEA